MKIKQYMPILKTMLAIDFDLLNEEWARKNHGQSLRRLAERGGLSLCEAAAIVKRRAWHSLTTDEALTELGIRDA